MSHRATGTVYAHKRNTKKALIPMLLTEKTPA